MKRSATRLHALLATFVVTIAIASSAHAALRAPQVSILGGGLQGYLNSADGGINVGTDQDATTSWTHTSSNTTGYTILLESSGGANNNALAIYNSTAGVPTMNILISGPIGEYGFSTATFKPGNQLTVNRYDENGAFLSTSTFNGVDPNGFSFALLTASGNFYTQDARNPGGKAQAVSFKGTGGNTGVWFLCFEDSQVQGGGSDEDFDDAVIAMESVNTTPVSTTTWGQLKTRMR
ncbi:MAG: DUF4114 domain-containing protein [Candidatus Eisenbacteria bacterium]|nr:DUF4114 domain-containing protein [Candidatus Eisenbacteria bacterium]